MTVKSLCVYCGSSSGARPVYAAAARRLGGLLGERGLRLVYGGSNVGVMCVLADAALAAGVHVTGVIPEALVAWERAHRGVSDLRVVGSMHERKALMAQLADAFVALPGGIGTLDELFETLTLARLGLHTKPVGLLNVDGYFDPLVALLDHAVVEGFVEAERRRLLLCDTEPERLLDSLVAFQAPTIVARH